MRRPRRRRGRSVRSAEASKPSTSASAAACSPRQATKEAEDQRGKQRHAQDLIKPAADLDFAITAGEARYEALEVLRRELVDAKFLGHLTTLRTRALLGIASDLLGQMSDGRFGSPIVLVWDNVRLHLTKSLGAFIEANADWLTVFQLPTYAPGLNPQEGIWSLVKRDIGNLAAADLSQITRAVRRKLKMLQYRPEVINGCLAGTGLVLEA
ncbi:transposase [Streptomyces sp. NBC_01361]|nr:transposase [Streptomyces sp. NBC_01361]